MKAKLEMIAANDFTPQMQLSHALKDARLALDAAEDTPLPIRPLSPTAGMKPPMRGMPIVTGIGVCPAGGTADKRVLSAKCRGRREGGVILPRS